MFNWPETEIERIKEIWPANLWDIRNEAALAEWIVSDASPLVIPDELIESAREFYRKNAFIRASLFFKAGWQDAMWFVETCENYRLAKEGELPGFSIEEAFIRICPEKIGGDTWNFLEANGALTARGAA